MFGHLVHLCASNVMFIRGAMLVIMGVSIQRTGQVVEVIQSVRIHVERG